MKKTILLLLAALAISCAPKDSLTVMSYNVRTSVKDDGENSWENRKEASKAMLEEVKPDIFGVQEARLDQLMLSARKMAAKTTDAPSCNGFKKPATKTIDYIYFTGFSQAAEFAVLDGEYAGKAFISDHYPIVSKLIF